MSQIGVMSLNFQEQFTRPLSYRFCGTLKKDCEI